MEEFLRELIKYFAQAVSCEGASNSISGPEDYQKW